LVWAAAVLGLFAVVDVVAQNRSQTQTIAVVQPSVLRIQIECGDSAVEFSITAPDGKQQFAFSNTSPLPLSFFFPAQSAGTYVLTITTVDDVAPEHIDRRISQLRRTEPGDEILITASKLLIRANNSSSNETPTELLNAIASYKEVLNLVRHSQALRERVEIEAIASVGIGRAQNCLNQAKLAADTLQRALAANVQDGTIQVSELVELARAYMPLGQPEKAIETAQKALAIANSAGEPHAKAVASEALADLHYELNEYSIARSHAEQAMKLYADIRNRRGYAHTLITLGLIASDLSNSDKAFSFYTQALSTSNAVKYRAGSVDALTYLGHLAAKEGRLHEAIEYYIEAGDQAVQLGDRLRQSWITSGLAYVYDQAGDTSRALEYYKRTLNLRLEVDNLSAEASIYNRLAAAYAASGAYQEAAQYFEKAATLYRFFKQWRFLFTALRDLGRVYESCGQFEKAAEYYAKAKPYADEVDDARAVALLLQGVGRLAERDAKWDLAFSSYSEALRLHRVAHDKRGESEAMFRLAMFSAKQGKVQDALRQLEETLEKDEELRREIQSPELRAAYVSDVRRHYEAHVDVLMQLHKESPKAGFMARAFEASEHARARSLLELMQDAQRNDSMNDPPELKARAEKLKDQLTTRANQRAQLLRLGPSKALTELNDQINQLSDDYERIQSAIRFRRAKTTPEAGLPRVRVLDEIQKELDKGTVLFEYTLGDERSYLWAVTTDSLDVFELPSRKVIEPLARRLYAAISEYPKPSAGIPDSSSITKQRQSLDADASALSKMILGPALSKIGDQRIVIVADGALQLVPFARLDISDARNQSGQAAEYSEGLIRTNEIVYLPSASLISVIRAEKNNSAPPQKLVAVFADPVFSADDPRITNSSNRRRRGPNSAIEPATQALRDAGLLGPNGEMRRLIASRWEADAIISAAGGNGIKSTDFGANVSVVLSPTLRDYRIIHFATHAVLDTERPALSGIVLSLFNERGEPQPGYLRAIDISTLNLAAELVTLSACQTAVGRQFNGEGMIGLSRAFMQAGTQRIVASLWKVDDSATAELMTQFYKEMFTNGKRPAAALKSAQLHVAEQKRWHHPYYWAGFVLQGEWR